ncbi:MAG: Crp/Fnr family transcriptional regulator [Lachnospiraceae bacterium]|nr:Crp/Fnr family transcriptional regulator [Lachnospiraceae bacterium]
MTTLDYLDKLNKVTLLQGLGAYEVPCFKKTIKKNCIANEVYSGREYVGIIVSGIMDVYSVLADATEVRMSQLKEGDIYGICNLFYDYERETILKCKNDCEIIFIAKEDFKELLFENQELMKRYLSLCNEKIAFLLRRTEILAMQSCKTKVIIYLLSSVSDGKVVLKDSKETLAKSLGISRAALFRELSDLKKKQLIKVSGHTISISSTEKLEESIYYQ